MCKAPETRYHPNQKTWDLKPGFLSMCTWQSPTSLWGLDEEASAPFHEGALVGGTLRVSWRPELGWRTFGSGSGGRRKTFLNIMSTSLAHWTWHSLPRTLALGLCPQGGVGLERGLWHSPAS